MPSQKSVKEVKTASKGASSSKKAEPKKTSKAAATASSKALATNPNQTDTKVKNKQTKAAKPPLKKAVEKVTKPSTVASIVKKAAKAVEKNLIEPVKKAVETDKKDKKTATKKETAAEKKSKADVSVEKETKVAAKAATTKTAKAESEKVKPVIIPKTSTDKKVDYEPDFLKSVLDAPAAPVQGPTMRYSDAELQEFKDLIGKKLDSAKKELAYLQGLITRRDEMGGDETDNRYMTMEDGGMSMEREQLSQMASRQITFIDHLEKALVRIENKTYGICRVTGKLIDKARLRAVPHATLSMEAKLGIAK